MTGYLLDTNVISETMRHALARLNPDLPAVATRHGLWDIFLAFMTHNDTAHDDGEDFAEATRKLLPAFIADAKALAHVIDEADDD